MIPPFKPLTVRQRPLLTDPIADITPGTYYPHTTHSGTSISMPAQMPTVTLTLLYDETTNALFDANGIVTGTWDATSVALEPEVQPTEPEPEVQPTEPTQPQFYSSTDEALRHLRQTMRQFGCSVEEARQLLRAARQMVLEESI